MAVKFKTKAERDAFLRKLHEPAKHERVPRPSQRAERPSEDEQDQTRAAAAG